MDKKTRVRLALSLVDKLSDRELDFDSTNLILTNYGLEPLQNSFGGPSLHDIVGQASDDQLIELAEYFDLEIPIQMAPTSQVPTVRTVRPLLIFGSHLSDHRALVGAVREQLLGYGIDLFVAHDTIAHDQLWQEEIEKALDNADAGIVFVHQGLRNSPWCDQEIGWLQGRHVPVMALMFDENPYGFFAKHQAQEIPRGADAASIAELLVDRIALKPELATAFAASLVSAMASSPSFAKTDAIWKRMRLLSALDADLCAQLLNATKTNNQIHWADSPWDGRRPYRRVVVDFLRQQPGAGIIAADLHAYVEYLDDQDAEAERRDAVARLRPPDKDPF